MLGKQIDKQLEAGVVEPAESEWANYIFLVPKMDGSNHFCVDYQRLDAATLPETYPFPRMDDCTDR